MTEKSLSLAIDATELTIDAAEKTEGGTLRVPAVLARSMIQDYDGLRVLKPSEELEAAARFADGIPITRGHPEAGIVTDRGEILGFLRNPTYQSDELSGILEIADKDLVADVESRKIEGLSVGFFCNLDRDAATDEYDAAQRNILLNHLAIVDKGRCSVADGCKILFASTDEIDSPPDLIGKIDTAIGMAEWDSRLKDLLMEIKQMIQKSAAATDAAIAENDALQEKIEQIIKTEKDAAIAELLAMQDAKTEEDLRKLKLDELTKELEMVRELRSDRLTINTGYRSINEAYARIGGRE